MTKESRKGPEERYELFRQTSGEVGPRVGDDLFIAAIRDEEPEERRCHALRGVVFGRKQENERSEMVHNHVYTHVAMLVGWGH